jgi:anti-sigma regulatory factor (Ser/Thr protein kinase)
MKRKLARWWIGLGIGLVAGVTAGWLWPQPSAHNHPYRFELAGDPWEVPAIAVGDIDRDGLDEWATVARSRDVDLYDHDGTWLRTWANVLVGRDRDSDDDSHIVLNPPFDFRGDGTAEFSAPYSLDSGISVLKILDLDAPKPESLYVSRGKGANGLTYRSHIIPLWSGEINRDDRPTVAVANQVGRSLYGRGLAIFRAGSLDTLWNFECPSGVSDPLLIAPFTSRTRNQIVVYSYGCGNGNITNQGRPDSVGWLFVLSDSGICQQAIPFPEFTWMLYLATDVNGDGYQDIVGYGAGVTVNEQNPALMQVWYGATDSLRAGPVTALLEPVHALELIPDGRDTLIMAGYRDGGVKLMNRQLQTVDSTHITHARWGTQKVRIPPGSTTAEMLVVVRDPHVMADHVHLESSHFKILAEITPDMKQITSVYPWIESSAQKHCGFMAFDGPNGKLMRYRIVKSPFFEQHRRAASTTAGGLLGLLLSLAYVQVLTSRQNVDLTRLVRRAFSPMLLLDRRGMVVDFNPGMASLLSNEPLVLNTPLVNGDSPDRLRRAVGEFMASGKREDVQLSDTPYPLEIRIGRLDNGHIICYARDLRGEQALTLSVQWAKILGMLAHRLKGRLQHLSSLTWRLRDHTDDVGMKTVQDLDAYIADITRQAARMSQLSAINECPLTALPVAAQIKDKIPRIAAVCSPPVRTEITVECGPEECLLANDLALQEVFENVMANAAASGPPPVRIMVTASMEELPEDGGRVHRWVVMRFTDSGQGMSPEDLAQLGKPLFTRREGGTGLGIAIMNQLMTMQKGRFEIDSQPGHGTCVTLWFQPAGG